MKLTILAILCLIGGSFGVENNKRTDPLDSIGYVNVRTSDTTVPISNKYPQRTIYAPIGGNVKVDIQTRRGDTITVVLVLNDALIYPICGITKVYPLWNGTDSTTCQFYDEAGVLRRGIGLGF